MLSVMGVADFAGKIVFGFMLDKFRSQSLTLTTVMLLLGAASVLGAEFWPGTSYRVCHERYKGFERPINSMALSSSMLLECRGGG